MSDTDDSSKRVTREDAFRSAIYTLISERVLSGAPGDWMRFEDDVNTLFDALPAIPAASETADAAWEHEKRDRLDTLYRTYAHDMNRTADAVKEAALLGIAIHEAALSRSTPTPPGDSVWDAVAREYPDSELLPLLGIKPVTSTPDATDAGSRREAGSVLPDGVESLPIEGLEARARAVYVTRNGYDDLVADLFTALRASLAAPSTPTTEGLDVLVSDDAIETTQKVMQRVAERRVAGRGGVFVPREDAAEVAFAVADAIREAARLGERP